MLSCYQKYGFCTSYFGIFTTFMGLAYAKWVSRFRVVGFRAQQARGDTHEGVFLASCCVGVPVRPLALSFVFLGVADAQRGNLHQLSCKA